MSSELLCLITVIVDKHIVLSLKTYSLSEYWDIGSYLAHLIYNYYVKLSFDCLLTTSVCCYDRKKDYTVVQTTTDKALKTTVQT